MKSHVNLSFEVENKAGFPEWFDAEMKKGRAKILRDEDGVFVGVEIFAPSGKVRAYPGDRVVLSRSGMCVLLPEAQKTKASVKLPSIEENEL